MNGRSLYKVSNIVYPREVMVPHSVIGNLDRVSACRTLHMEVRSLLERAYHRWFFAAFGTAIVRMFFGNNDWLFHLRRSPISQRMAAMVNSINQSSTS